MAQRIVRKITVCFFQEGEHTNQNPVEKVTLDLRIDREKQGSTQLSGEGGKQGGQDDFVRPRNLQVNSFKFLIKKPTASPVSVFLSYAKVHEGHSPAKWFRTGHFMEPSTMHS